MEYLIYFSQYLNKDNISCNILTNVSNVLRLFQVIYINPHIYFPEELCDVPGHYYYLHLTDEILEA